MFRDISRYVRSCPSCQQYKQLQQSPLEIMHRSKNVNPWETVSTDLVRTLPRSSKRNVYLLVFQDRYTKLIHCRAIRKATPPPSQKHCSRKRLFVLDAQKLSLPLMAPNIPGEFFVIILQRWQFTIVLPRCTRRNVICANKTFKTMIAQYSKQIHRKWDVFLPQLTFAMNTARHDSKKFTPNVPCRRSSDEAWTSPIESYTRHRRQTRIEIFRTI